MPGVKKDPHYISIGGSAVIQLQLVKANFAPLLATLGIEAGDAAGNAPTGKVLAGKGTQSALEAGCVAINAVYAVSGGKVQTAKILCSPTKASTAFKDLKGLKYGTRDIVETRTPRRRKYVF